MGKYEDEKANLEKISAHLAKAGIKHDWIDLGSEEKFPAIYTNYTYKGWTFDVLILNHDDWISAKCMIMDTEGFDLPLKCTIYELVLGMNFQLPETTFSADAGQIFIEADMKTNVTYDDFMNVELNSIAIGIDAIVDELDAAKAPISSTEGQLKTEGTKK